VTEAIAAGPSEHAAPFIVETLSSKALYFSDSAVQSRMRLDDPHALDLDYTRLMMGFLLFKPRPGRMAMIGLGGGSLPKFCHRYLPAAHIEVIEIDPGVIALRDQFHVPPDSARFRVLEEDGVRFVREQASCVDVLIVDGFDELGLPPQLATRAFYDDCRDSLAEGGMMVANLHAGRELSADCVERIRGAFSDRVLIVDSADDCNSIAFAFKDETPLACRAAARHRPAQLQKLAAHSLRFAFASVERALQQLKPALQLRKAGAGTDPARRTRGAPENHG
jgi:spermidine synthase